MSTVTTGQQESADTKAVDFSLVLGGPVYQLWRRVLLSGESLELLRRRVMVLTLVAWFPLLLLSAIEGRAWGSQVKMPFLFDIELHTRLLVALPLLILAELVVHQRMRPLVAQFLERGLVPDSARSRFDAAVAEEQWLRNSLVAEMVLITLVYVLGVTYIWRTQVALPVTSWYGASVDGQMRLSLAGWWLACVSLPMFQILLLRWYFRLIIWARFLWRVSRINLQLIPLHPDRCGGLGFLATATYAFGPLLLAQGALLAGVIADKIFYAGGQLTDFKSEIVGLLLVVMLTMLAPLLVFSPALIALKQKGLNDYGTLAQHYVRDFDRKWFRPGTVPDEGLMGSADIQSLSDLANSYEVVQGMKPAPFTLQTVVQLAVVTLLPILPLALTMMSMEDLLQRLLKIVL